MLAFMRQSTYSFRSPKSIFSSLSMIQVLRKNQRAFMLVVAVLTIVAFAFLYNTVSIDELSAIRNPTIYGKPLKPVDIERQVKNYQLTMALGQYELIGKLGGGASDQDAALTEFVWNLLVLQHEAAAMGIEPTDDQVADRIMALPNFQTSGQFDPTKYASFVAEQLTPRGFTERQLEEVMRDSLRLEAIESIVGAPAAVGQAEFESISKINQPVTAGVVRFEFDPSAIEVNVGADEVAAVYEERKASLRTNETRTVDYVEFRLPEDSALEGRAKVEALQELADRASAFVDLMAGKNLDLRQAAKESGAEVKALPAFDREGVIDREDAKASDGTTAAAVAPQVFLLGRPGGATDIIQSGDAFLIASLTGIEPSRQMTLEEAREDIEAELAASRRQAEFEAATQASADKLRVAVEAGESLADAARGLGLDFNQLDGIVPVDPAIDFRDRMPAAATLLLREGELSGAERAPWGAFVVQLTGRGEADAEGAEEEEKMLRGDILERKRDLLFAEWLRVSRESAGITVPGSGQG
jgi:hypothetical protein